MKDWLKILQNIKGKFSLSYYDFPQLSEWFPKDKYVWKSREFFRSSASFSESKSEKGTELLIMNYDTDYEDLKESLCEVGMKSMSEQVKKEKELVKKYSTEDSSGLLEASGLKEILEEKPMIDKDDFWN